MNAKIYGKKVMSKHSAKNWTGSKYMHTERYFRISFGVTDRINCFN